jgi:hypothetical protein
MRAEGEDRKRRIKSEAKLLPIASEEPKQYQLVLSEPDCSASFKRSMSSAAAAAVSRGLAAA